MTAARSAAKTPPTITGPPDGSRVRVVEHISEQLAGVPGGRYDSPPQTRADALDLVRVLLGAVPDLTRSHWERPIAGGHRSVELVWEPTR